MKLSSQSSNYLSAISMAVLLQFSHVSQAASINYNVNNIHDNRWQYNYEVKNEIEDSTVAEFSVFFQLGSYENLEIISSPVDWDPIVLQPEQLLAADGVFDFLALTAGIEPGSTQGGFSVAFDFLGIGLPGPHSYQIYDTDMNLLSEGTIATIPAPPTVWLLLTAIGIIILFQRKSTISL